MSKEVGVKENGANAQALWKYSLTQQKVKLWSKRLWVGKSCWGKGIKFKLADKALAPKKKLLQVFMAAC